MTIRFEHDEIEALLSELEKTTGREREDVLLDVLRREHERLEREIAEGIESGRLLHERTYARALIDPRPIGELLAYDENGLPV